MDNWAFASPDNPGRRTYRLDHKERPSFDHDEQDHRYSYRQPENKKSCCGRNNVILSVIVLFIALVAVAGLALGIYIWRDTLETDTRKDDKPTIHVPTDAPHTRMPKKTTRGM